MRWLFPLLLLVAAPAQAADVAVVCPEGLREALRPWVEHRVKQGYSVQFFDARGTAAEIQASIREHARRRPLSCVLIVGDAAPNRAPVNRPLLGGSPLGP